MGNRFWRSNRRSEEFQEEDVWNIIKEDQELGIKIDDDFKPPTSPLSISRRLPSATRMFPGTQQPEKNHEVHDSDGLKLVQHSAPISIPDWSKIYGKPPKKKDDSSSTSSHHYHDYRRDHNYDVHVHHCDEESGDVDDDWDGYDDDDRLPPHEWLAKKSARSQISVFSVCEGAGRTLKGRDLSRVRNAVLSKTGFI